MAKAKDETKAVMEKTYTIPLSPEWLKVARYKRAKKAMTAIRNFLARHMKVYDKDIDKIKIDKWINQAVWTRGIKHPPQKITIKAIKYDDGTIKTEFISLPSKFKAEDEGLKKKINKAKLKEEKARTEKEKKKKEEKVEEKKEVQEEKQEKTEEEKEKEKILHKEVAQPRQKQINKTKEDKKDKISFRKALEK